MFIYPCDHTLNYECSHVGDLLNTLILCTSSYNFQGYWTHTKREIFFARLVTTSKVIKHRLKGRFPIVFARITLNGVTWYYMYIRMWANICMYIVTRFDVRDLLSVQHPLVMLYLGIWLIMTFGCLLREWFDFIYQHSLLRSMIMCGELALQVP